jgi:hypothetical protein
MVQVEQNTSYMRRLLYFPIISSPSQRADLPQRQIQQDSDHPARVKDVTAEAVVPLQEDDNFEGMSPDLSLPAPPVSAPQQPRARSEPNM